MRIGKYKHKLLLLLCLISLFPLTVMSVFNYEMTSSNAEAQVEKLSNQLLEQVENTNSRIHEHIVSMTQELAGKFNNYLPYFRNYTSPSVLEFLADIEQKYMLYNSYIHSIYIIDVTERKVFSSLNYTLKPLDEEGYVELAELAFAQSAQLGVGFKASKVGAADVLTYYMAVEAGDGKKGFVVVNAWQNDVSKWQELMARNNQGYFYLTNHRFQPLYESSEALYEEFRTSHDGALLMSGVEASTVHARLGGKQYLVIHKQGSNSALHYWLFIPKETFTKKAFQESFMFLIVGFLCLVASGIGVYGALSYVYSPIQRISRRLQPKQSLTDDPLKLDQMLQAIVGENEHLNEIVAHNRYDLMQRLLERILFGKFVHEGVVRLHKLRVVFPHRCFTVVAMEKSRQHHINGELTNMDEELLLYGMGNIGEEVFGDIGIAKAVLLQDRYVVLIVNHDVELEPGGWKELCHTLRTNIRHYLRIDAGAGIGNTKEHYADIAASYHESLQALSVNHLVEDGFIAHVEEVDGSAQGGGQALLVWTSYEEAFVEHIRAASKGGLEALVEDIRRDAVDRQAKPFEIYMLAMQFIGSCLRLAKELALPADSVLEEPEALIRNLQQNYKLKDISDAMLVIGIRMIELLELKKKSINHAMVLRAEEIVRSNLGWGIEQIADHMYISSSYLSKIFKEETGHTIGEYMIREKMENAKRLLIASDVSVQDIAERVGYSTSRGFYKQFKETTGLTPSEYRKHQLLQTGGREQ